MYPKRENQFLADHDEQEATPEEMRGLAFTVLFFCGATLALIALVIYIIIAFCR